MSPDDVDSLSVAPARRGPHPARPRRGTGFTLVEILIAISILAILAVLAVVATRAAIDSARKGTARATMRMIMVGIEEYSRFWPASKRAVTGFPEWSAANLWVVPPPTGATYARPVEDGNDPREDQNEANECLAYSLLAQVGEGPYLRNPPGEVVASLTQDFAARYGLGGAGVPVQQLVDPWGKPFAYQWLDEDNRPVTNNSTVGVRVRLFSGGPDHWFGRTADQDPNEADNIYEGPEPEARDSLF
ncbi:MAG TPA: prepilin-type N-terminal cleavage/methylation domain-containing protein [Phycisphaerae bacterium]|nr:prepilin-type N-terminal cleavage/methylation domain-containing protein [Phycisphaerae bacterium]